jgi:hypothetical protein
MPHIILNASVVGPKHGARYSLLNGPGREVDTNADVTLASVDMSLSNVNVSHPEHTCGATGVPVTFRISSANGNRVKLFCAKSFY